MYSIVTDFTGKDWICYT